MRLRRIKICLQDLYDRYLMSRAAAEEIRKFRDPRRREIYEKCSLSDGQKREIDALFLDNYGEKIPYTWHRHYTMYTGNFDVRYFPEMLYIPEFERFMNDGVLAEALSDKNLLPLIAESIGVRMPASIISRIRGIYHDHDMNVISEGEAIQCLENAGIVFAKPSVDTSSGEKCMRLQLVDGVDQGSGTPLKDILKLLGEDFCVQACVRCHESIRSLYSGSVNTFRIITYIWKEEVIAMPVILRIGRGGAAVDNAHAGGMFIAVSDDGILHRSAFTEFREEYTEHPDTHVVFDGYEIPHFADVISAAKRMHGALSQIGVINWDFTIDESGTPVLIEANTSAGGIWVIEMAHGIGCFRDKTEEILRWLRVMKKTPKSQREKYRYGRLNG